jgi:hypothetical protein
MRRLPAPLRERVGGAAFFRDALEWVFAEAEDENALPCAQGHGGRKLKEVR